MIIPTTVNIDWLHSTIQQLLSGRYRHRRQGKTLAYIMLMMGEIHLGGDQNCYLYIGETSVVTRQVSSELYRLARSSYPSVPVVKLSDHRMRVGDKLFLFYPITQLIADLNIISGWAIDRIFMDIDDQTQRRLDDQEKLTPLFDYLVPRLAYKRGDVI